MNLNYLLVCFLGISAYFVADTDARVAIVGGDEVLSVINPHRFQYQVSLQINNHHYCGGGIIGADYVLTAAHCVIHDDNSFFRMQIFVLAGTIDLSRPQAPAVKVQVERIYVPDAYKSHHLYSSADIAVLRLSSSLDLKKTLHFRKLDLPENQQNDFTGQSATLAGWGWDEVTVINHVETGRRSQDKLLQAATTVLSKADSLQSYPQISDTDLCARIHQRSHQVRGACTGDSGGPLVHLGKIIGILSKSPIGCNEQHHPAIYTRVSHYLTFIRNARSDQVTATMRTYPLRHINP